MLLPQVEFERAEHPVDIVERLASLNDWRFDRDDQDEISIVVSGGYAEYNVAFTWLPQFEALHLACAFDLKAPERRRAETATLASMINERLWIGHFDVWNKDGVVMFRHAMLLTGGAEPTPPVPDAAGQCGRGLRVLFSSLSIRRLGGQTSRRSARKRYFRDPGRSLMDAAPSSCLFGAGKMGQALLGGWLGRASRPSASSLSSRFPTPRWRP